MSSGKNFTLIVILVIVIAIELVILYYMNTTTAPFVVPGRTGSNRGSTTQILWENDWISSPSKLCYFTIDYRGVLLVCKGSDPISAGATPSIVWKKDFKLAASTYQAGKPLTLEKPNAYLFRQEYGLFTAFKPGGTAYYSSDLSNPFTERPYLCIDDNARVYLSSDKGGIFRVGAVTPVNEFITPALSPTTDSIYHPPGRSGLNRGFTTQLLWENDYITSPSGNYCFSISNEGHMNIYAASSPSAAGANATPFASLSPTIANFVAHTNLNFINPTQPPLLDLNHPAAYLFRVDNGKFSAFYPDTSTLFYSSEVANPYTPQVYLCLDDSGRLYMSSDPAGIYRVGVLYGKSLFTSPPLTNPNLQNLIVYPAGRFGSNKGSAAKVLWENDWISSPSQTYFFTVTNTGIMYIAKASSPLSVTPTTQKIILFTPSLNPLIPSNWKQNDPLSVENISVNTSTGAVSSTNSAFLLRVDGRTLTGFYPDNVNGGTVNYHYVPTETFANTIYDLYMAIDDAGRLYFSSDPSGVYRVASLFGSDFTGLTPLQNTAPVINVTTFSPAGRTGVSRGSSTQLMWENDWITSPSKLYYFTITNDGSMYVAKGTDPTSAGPAPLKTWCMTSGLDPSSSLIDPVTGNPIPLDIKFPPCYVLHEDSGVFRAYQPTTASSSAFYYESVAYTPLLPSVFLNLDDKGRLYLSSDTAGINIVAPFERNFKFY